jgi:phage terminase large subunit
MQIDGTGVFDDLWKALNDKSVRGIVLEGGSRSSKTWSICQALYLLGTQTPQRFAIARWSRTWIKPTVLDTFKKVFKSVEEWKEESFNKSELTYQHYGLPMSSTGLMTRRSYTVLRPISFGLTRLLRQARMTSTN